MHDRAGAHASRREPTICFVLPDGLGLGGVTTWSCQMAALLCATSRPSSLIEHINDANPWMDSAVGHMPRMRLRALHPGAARHEDLPTYLPTYLAALPATLVPNYTEGAYATAARASQSDAEHMRVLAFAHADQDYYYSLLQRYERIATLLIAVSDEIAEKLAERMPHRAADIRTRPYGVACERMLQRSWSRSGAPLRIAYAGRLSQPQKRILDLPEVALRLAARKVDFTLEIVGSGEDESRLRDACSRLPREVATRIQFMGRIPASNMPTYWKTVDTSLLVSAFEGTSIAMLESMAAGCAPVVTKVSGTRKAITHGISGFVHEIGDVNGIAESLAKLAADREQLERVGRAAHEQTARDFPLPDYTRWFGALTEEAWTMAPRAWPKDLDVFCWPRIETPAAPSVRPPRISITRFARKTKARWEAWRNKR